MLYWNDDWSHEDYVWPITSVPVAAVVEDLGKAVVARGGRANKEAHADRSIVMDFPNGATGTRLRKHVPRAECRRRAQVTLPDVAEEPLKVCVVCDAVHLWPKFDPGRSFNA